jgi:hypothetical protein
MKNIAISICVHLFPASWELAVCAYLDLGWFGGKLEVPCWSCGVILLQVADRLASDLREGVPVLNHHLTWKFGCHMNISHVMTWYYTLLIYSAGFGSHLNSFAPFIPSVKLRWHLGSDLIHSVSQALQLVLCRSLTRPRPRTEAHRLGAFISKKSGFSLSIMSCAKKVPVWSVWVLCRCWQMLIETKNNKFHWSYWYVEVLNAFSALKVMLRAYRFSVFWCGLRMFEEKVVTLKGVLCMNSGILFIS